MYRELLLFQEKEGHTRVPVSYPHNPKLAHWADNQRKKFKRASLSSKRVKALMEIGFEFNLLEHSWDYMKNQLVRFKDEYGHVYVSQLYTTTENDRPPLALGQWVSTQRREYKKMISNQHSNMTQHRSQVLKDIGFVFDFQETSWEHMFTQLQHYHDQHGDCNVPKRYEHNPQLGSWVQTQRTSYHNQNLSTQRIEVLNTLNFVYDVYDDAWMDKFHHLQHFYDYHGHANIPLRYESNPSLGIWVSTQRSQYNAMKKNRPTRMTQQRIDLLNTLDFVFDVRTAVWMEHHRELQSYIENNGHSQPPTKSSLGKWAQNQRRSYRAYMKGSTSNRMTRERIQALENIGFVWENNKNKRL